MPSTQALRSCSAAMWTRCWARGIGSASSRCWKSPGTGEKLDAVEPYRALAPYEEGQGALHRAGACVFENSGWVRSTLYLLHHPRGARPHPFPQPGGAARRKRGCAAKAGHAEIVLTGIRLASYGRERGLTLADALKAAAETDVQRIRLGSLDPDEISQDLIDACAAEEKFCRQFHLSLQSGCDKTLHRMARRYTTAQFADTVARIRAAMPDAVFTTDVMCGFVGETEEEPPRFAGVL